MKGLIITILALSLVLSAYAQDDEESEVVDVGNDITVDFAVLPSGVSVPPSFQMAGMTFFAHSSPDFYANPFDPFIADWGPPHERSYVFPDEGVTVVLPLEAWAIEVRLCPSDTVLVEAYSSTGILITQELGHFFYGCHDLFLPRVLDSDLISVVRFTGGYNEASIARLRAILSTSPVVDAGDDQFVQFVAAGELAYLYLQGSAWDPATGISRATLTPVCAPENPEECYSPFANAAWEQTGGTEVFLEGSDFFAASFAAPEVSAQETLTFRLTVTNHDGERGSDDVKVVIYPPLGS